MPVEAADVLANEGGESQTDSGKLAVSTKEDLGRFLEPGMYQPPLKCLVSPIAFQADDEGSIHFTRSDVFNGLAIVSNALKPLRRKLVEVRPAYLGQVRLGQGRPGLAGSRTTPQRLSLRDNRQPI